jgi:hypothetical protein
VPVQLPHHQPRQVEVGPQHPQPTISLLAPHEPARGPHPQRSLGQRLIARGG